MSKKSRAKQPVSQKAKWDKMTRGYSKVDINREPAITVTPTAKPRVYAGGNRYGKSLMLAAALAGMASLPSSKH